jgi:hypothetical protein
MYNHPDVGLAMQIQNAIKAVIYERKNICEDSPLSSHVLGLIREKIYILNKNPEPYKLLFHAFAGKTANPVEAALQYIEKLMR